MAKPKASYPGLQTRTGSSVESVHTHILQILLLRVPTGWNTGDTCLAISTEILRSIQLCD